MTSINTRGVKPGKASKRSFDEFRDICQVYGSHYWGEALGNDYYRQETDALDFPVLRAVDALPLEVWPFRDGPAKSHPNAFMEFCVDDFCFETVWTHGAKYSAMFKANFAGVIGPDFSLLPGMPIYQILFNVWRSRACVWRWQHDGLLAVPFIRWYARNDSCLKWITAGVEPGGTLACGAHGNQRDEAEREFFEWGFERVTEILRPKRWLVIGSVANKKFVDRMREKCEVVIYKQSDIRKTRDAFRRQKNGGQSYGN